MYVRNIKKGFATNSSSYHSTILLTENQYNRWIDPTNNVTRDPSISKFIEVNTVMVYNEPKKAFQTFEDFKHYVENTDGEFNIELHADPQTGEGIVAINFSGYDWD